MHDTAEAIGGYFLSTYSKSGDTVVEIGAYNVNGTIRGYAHPEAKYIGVDITSGPDVDVVAPDEQSIPLPSHSADIVIATSVFEHSSFFWQTMLEMLRITKEGGVLYISAPSNGWYHRHPNDNWRFYPDAGKMLEKWGQVNGFAVKLIESFIAERDQVAWNDFVAVFQVEPLTVSKSFLSERFKCTNVWLFGSDKPLNFRKAPEDMVLLLRAQEQIEAREAKFPHPEIVDQERFIDYQRRCGQVTSNALARLDELKAKNV